MNDVLSETEGAIDLQTALSDGKREVMFDDQATKIAMKLYHQRVLRYGCV